MKLDIKISKIDEIVNTMDSITRDLQDCYNDVERIKNGLSVKGELRYNIIEKINIINNGVAKKSQKWSDMSENLRDISEVYKGTESKIADLGVAVQVKPVDNKPESVSNENTEKTGWHFGADEIMEIVGSLGIAGKTVEGIYKMVTKNTAQRWISFLNLGCDITEGVLSLKNCTTTTKWIKEFFGVSASEYNRGLAGAKEYISDEFPMGQNAASTGTLATAAKWAGHVLTVACSLFDNLDERKEAIGRGENMSYERVIGETAIESIVDIGLATGAGAVMAAIGGPAIVGVGAVIALNTVCKWASGGKDIGEVVADGVYDLADKAADGIEKIKDKVADNVDNVANAVEGGFNAIKKSFGAIF